jgi:hypothetical protein
VKSHLRWSSLLFALFMIVGLLPFASSAAAAATPPWEPDGNSEGNIVFYNAAGNIITGGSNLNHLFDYAAATSAATRPTTRAQVFFAFPDHNNTVLETWFQSVATSSTFYPTTTAPASINAITNPVATAASTEANLNAALGGAVLDESAGYAHIVQLRLFDSGPGLGNGKQPTPYWQADISYDSNAGTWTQVYPATAQATTTTLAGSPADHQTPGGTVVLTATVTPGGTAGSVDFKDGNTDLGSMPVSGGTATLSTSTLSTGEHSLTGTFTPTDTSAFSPSTSTALDYVIANVPGAPATPTATAGNASANVSWTAPSDIGGVPLTGYDVEYSSDNGTTWKHASSAFHSDVTTHQTVAHLINGTAYVFRVAAINAAGTGAYSAKSGAVKPHADATSLTISKPVTINSGKAATIKAKLTDRATHKAIGNAALTLLAAPSKSKPFKKVGSAKTNSSGAASISVKPKAKTFYEWSYTGTTRNAAATSSADVVSVRRGVHATAKPTSAKKGAKFSVFGTVAPAAAKLKVSLQEKVGAKFKNIATAMTKQQKLPNGKRTIGYVFTVKESKAGSYDFRVTVPATSTLSAGTSNTVTVKVV